jgi:[ribosomal protein S18]-alanine N-acetyltransferase
MMKTRGIVLEPMRRKHLKQILEIENQVYPRPWTHGVFVDELAAARRAQRYYVVALSDAHVVGYAGIMLGVEEAHVTNIAVDPSRQGAGIGHHLMLDLCSVARECACKSMSLEVRVSNKAAQSLYAKFGFVPAGIRQRYYENSEDAIVMWCQDIDQEAFAAQLRALAGGDPDGD